MSPEAITILVATANGAGEYKKIIGITQAGILLSSVCMIMVGIIYWAAPQLLIGVDIAANSNLPLTQLATRMLMLCAVYQILDSIRIIISGVLRGMGDSQYPMWISSIAFWIIGLPIGYGLAFGLHWQGTGLWYGLIIAAIFSILLQYYRLKQKF